jgi:DNA-binding FrmR family transcriptional regulator
MNSNLPTELQENIDKRLQRMEGQVRGVRRMLEEGRDCQEILNQLSAIRGAAYQISLLLVENYAVCCVNNPQEYGSVNEAIAKMVSTLGKLG